MTNVISFHKAGLPSHQNNTLVEPRTPIQKHMDKYQWHFGRDAYWFFVNERNCLPDKAEAIGLANLLGHRVKSNDGKYYGARPTPKNIKAKSSTSNLEELITLLAKDIHSLAKLASGLETTSDTQYAKHNKDKCEHIANQLQIALSFTTRCLNGAENVTWGSSGRITSSDKGICRN